MTFKRRFKTVAVEEAQAVINPETGAPVRPVVGPDHMPSMTKDLLLAGKATFVVANPEGKRYVYKVKALKGEYKGKVETSYLLSVQANGGKFPYRYIGVLLKDGTIKSTGKSSFVAGTKEFDVAQWAVRKVFNGDKIPGGYDITHADKCGRCTKTLPEADKADGLCLDCHQQTKGFDA